MNLLNKLVNIYIMTRQVTYLRCFIIDYAAKKQGTDQYTWHLDCLKSLNYAIFDAALLQLKKNFEINALLSGW